MPLSRAETWTLESVGILKHFGVAKLCWCFPHHTPIFNLEGFWARFPPRFQKVRKIQMLPSSKRARNRGIENCPRWTVRTLYVTVETTMLRLFEVISFSNAKLCASLKLLKDSLAVGDSHRSTVQSSVVNRLQKIERESSVWANSRRGCGMCCMLKWRRPFQLPWTVLMASRTRGQKGWAQASTAKAPASIPAQSKTEIKLIPFDTY